MLKIWTLSDFIWYCRKWKISLYLKKARKTTFELKERESCLWQSLDEISNREFSSRLVFLTTTFKFLLGCLFYLSLFSNFLKRSWSEIRHVRIVWSSWIGIPTAVHRTFSSSRTGLKMSLTLVFCFVSDRKKLYLSITLLLIGSWLANDRLDDSQTLRFILNENVTVTPANNTFCQ